MTSIRNLIGPVWFFCAVLVAYIGVHLYLHHDLNKFNLSSDVWMVQFASLQQRGEVWDHVPPFYNQEKYYLTYPIIYHLNPGLESGMFTYQAMMLLLIIATYLATGLVFYKIFGNWHVAALGGLMFLIPHQIFTTRFGLLGFGNLRGVGFSFPFYAPLGYYWIMCGLHHQKQNIALALLAAFSVYLYPPFGVLVVPLIVLTAAIHTGRRMLRPLMWFVLVYIGVSGLFWYGHFSNPHAGMLDNDPDLSVDQLAAQQEIIDYRIPDGSLRGIDFGVAKRAVWDGLPLIALLVISPFVLRKKREELSQDSIGFYHLNLKLMAVVLAFVLGVEVVNTILYLYSRPPFFIEHLRLLRFLGFALVGQSVWVMSVLFWGSRRWFLGCVVVTFLLFSPLSLSAPLVRDFTRRFFPEEIRRHYNLAPIVPPSETRSPENLSQAALWAKSQSVHPGNKFFVFSDDQEDFKFKVISQQETNLTNKEGSIWITSGIENSQKWYQERLRYDQVVASGDFGAIVDLARSLQSSHIVLPRGKFTELYEASGESLRSVYRNGDYSILEI